MRMTVSVLAGLSLTLMIGFPREASPQSGSGPREIRGRIVAFDWAGHWSNTNEDLVVRVLGSDTEGAKYLRIAQTHSGGAALLERRDIIGLSVFIGRGPAWIFRIRTPSTQDEKSACGKPGPDIPFEDESGKGAMPRFIKTPGAENERVPPIETLRCFVLEQGGISPDQPPRK
jgi:hypothetical protein